MKEMRKGGKLKMLVSWDTVLKAEKPLNGLFISSFPKTQDLFSLRKTQHHQKLGHCPAKLLLSLRTLLGCPSKAPSLMPQVRVEYCVH